MAKRRAQFLLKQDREADILKLDSGFLADTAPIPPVALFTREVWVAGLFDGADESVVDAGVLARVGELAKAVVEFVAILSCKFGHRAYGQQIKVLEQGFPDAAEVGQLAGFVFRCGGHHFSINGPGV